MPTSKRFLPPGQRCSHLEARRRLELLHGGAVEGRFVMRNNLNDEANVCGFFFLIALSSWSPT